MRYQPRFSHWLNRCFMLMLSLLPGLGLALGPGQPAQAQAFTPGYVMGWGANFDGQLNTPAGLSGVIAIAAGFSQSLALKSNGAVVAWGCSSDDFGQCSVPAGLSGVSAIAAGLTHSLALKSDGTVVAWGCGGRNDFGQCTVPSGLSSVSAIAAGYTQSLALKSNGTVVAWGCSNGNDNGPCSVPAGLSGVIAIAASDTHSLALKSNGTVVAWGCSNGNDNGPCSVPAGLSGVSAIAAGLTHSLALKSDGTVVAWGCSGGDYGQCSVPAGLSGVIAIAAGYTHSLALNSNGTVVAWGCSNGNDFGQCRVPAGVHSVTAIAAGSDHSLVINDPFPPTTDPSQSPSASAYGWNNSDVTVFWGWSDLGRGIDFSHCTTRSTSSGEGVQTLTATCQDKAGNVGTASYTVKVDKTGPVANPTLSPAANAAGWNNTNVTVNWNWTDPSTGSGTGSGLDAAFCPTSSTSSGFGVQTLTAQCADQAGNVTSVSYTLKVDRARPQILAQVGPTASGFGWNNSAVTVSFTCQDQVPSAGLATNTVGGNATFSNEGSYPAFTNTGTCADNADNVATSVTVGPFNIDLTKPTISAAATTAPNGNGWYNSAVTIHFTCTNALSGIATCPDDQVLNSEGTAVASTAQTSRDKALNFSDSSNVVTIHLDKTVPVVTLTGVSNGANYLAGNVPAVGCTTTDTLSDVATPATLNITGGNPDGSGTFTATCSGATDKAGNSAAPVSVSYLVEVQINSSVSQQRVNGVYNATQQACPVSGGNLPIHTVTPTLRNTSTKSYSNLVFKVKTLEYSTAQSGQKPTLCNATSGNGGVGSQFTIANSTLPGNNSQLNPGEELLPVFQVGLPVRAQYRFFVDLYSVSVTAAADGAAQEGEYLGSFVYTLDVNEQGVTVNQLFLPLVTR